MKRSLSDWSIDDRAGLRDVRALCFERSPLFAESMACWAAIFVAPLDPVEIAIWKRAVVTRRALPNRYVRIDAFLLNHPRKHRPCSVGRVTDQTFGFECEALFNPIDHRLGGLHLLRSVCRCGLNIDDDPRVQVNQIVC